jgi:hypothetical protein
MGEVEFGKCECCGNEDFLTRTYFRYPIKCECHSPQHFELVCHCKNCTPVEPTITKITLKTSELNILLRGTKIKKIKDNLDNHQLF